MHSWLEELSHHCHFQIHIISCFLCHLTVAWTGSRENGLPDQKPKTKKAKLAEFLQFSSNLPKHSQNALAAILEKAKKSGIPDLHGSNQQREARLQLLDSCHGGALGPLIQEANLVKDDGTTTTMFFANLLVYMMAIYHQDGSWTKLVQQHHAECPSTINDPWGLILYCDEIIPGNVLGRAERKVWTIYATFLQFGDHLSHEDAWLTISVERSAFVATLGGGIAQMMGHVLQSIFCCPIQDPRLGFRLKATSGDTTLFFNLSMVLADGAAQKQVWSSKGDSGTKFCLLCANVHGQVAKHADEEPY